MRGYVPPRIYGLVWISFAVGIGEHIVFDATDTPTVVVSCIAIACLTIAGILNLIYGHSARSES